MIDLPKPAPSMGALTKDEMERFCYPIFNLNNPRGNTFFGRLANTISPPKMNPENWFLNPNIDGPAYRPPQYMVTSGGIRH